MSRVPASPYFFRPVKRAFIGALVALVVGAILVPAPLEIAADPASPPNPAKSAWFLLWIQELVSWHTLAIWVAIVFALLLVALPWLGAVPVEHAKWFRREHAVFWTAALLAALVVLLLTIVGVYFRGADWCIVSPF